MEQRLYKKVTKSGGVSIPAQVRRTLGIQPGDAMELEVTEENLIKVKPYNLRCCFCETDEEVYDFHGKGICKSCCEKIVKGMSNK